MRRFLVPGLIAAAVLIASVALLGKRPPARQTMSPQPAQSPTEPEVRPPSPDSKPDSRQRIPDTADVVASPLAAPTGAQAMIVSPAHGATVSRSFTIEMAVTGMTLAPAGSDNPNAGHFHLLVDTSLVDAAAPVRRDERHFDFGNGAATATIELPRGDHTLQLVMGDGNHVPHNPPVLSPTITITVDGAGNP